MSFPINQHDAAVFRQCVGRAFTQHQTHRRVGLKVGMDWVPPQPDAARQSTKTVANRDMGRGSFRERVGAPPEQGLCLEVATCFPLVAFASVEPGWLELSPPTGITMLDCNVMMTRGDAPHAAASAQPQESALRKAERGWRARGRSIPATPASGRSRARGACARLATRRRSRTSRAGAARDRAADPIRSAAPR